MAKKEAPAAPAEDNDADDMAPLEQPSAEPLPIAVPAMAKKEKPSLPSVHVPVTAVHLKHAVVGSKVHIHLRGTVKGVRSKEGRYQPNHEVEVEPEASSVGPAKGGKNKFTEMAEDD